MPKKLLTTKENFIVQNLVVPVKLFKTFMGYISEWIKTVFLLRTYFTLGNHKINITSKDFTLN